MSETKFKIGPCAIVFNGQFIGATIGGAELTLDSTSSDIKTDQTLGQVLTKKLRGMTLTIETELREIENAMNLLLDSNGQLSLSLLGREITNSGELLMIPYNPEDSCGYHFPNVAIHKKTRYVFRETEEHSLQLSFEAFPNENGIIMEKIAVSDAQRQTLPMLPEIDPAQVERALTKYIAEKLNLTVDKEIFRGGLPLGVDGVGVELTREELSNSVGLRTVSATVECLNVNRDYVFTVIQKICSYLPAYGETIAIANGEIKLMVITKHTTMFKRVTDSGRIKTSGWLELSVKI